MGSESVCTARRAVKGRAHLQQLKWKQRDFVPLVLQDRRWRMLAEVLLEAPMPSSTASQQFQLLLICKHEYLWWKPCLQNSAHLMAEKTGLCSSVLCHSWADPGTGKLIAIIGAAAPSRGKARMIPSNCLVNDSG